MTKIFSGSFGRQAVRVLIFVALVTFLVGNQERAAMGIMTLSPLLGLTNVLSTGFGWLTILPALAAAGAVWKRRFFCRFVCPLGLLQDILRKNAPPVPGWKTPRWWAAGGIIAALGTLEVVFVGGVTLLFLDPMTLFAALGHGSPWAWLLAAGILVCALILPYFWCFCLCPCGGLQEILWRIPRLFKRSQSETQPGRRKFLKILATLALGTICGKALQRLGLPVSFFRPPGALPEPEFLARCTRCGNCVASCPTEFLKVVPSSDSITAYGTPTLEYQPENPEARTFCDENCTRCGRVCPTGALRVLEPEDKPKMRLARVRVEMEHCRIYFQKECAICGRECPSEAISFEWSDDFYAKIPVINSEVCTGCGRCIAFCPGEPPLWGMGDEPAAGPKALIALKLEEPLENS